MVSPYGAASAIVDAVLRGDHTLVTSRDVEAEYVELAMKRSVVRLLERHGISQQEFLEAVADVRLLAEVVTPEGEAPWCRDEHDRCYLHCAVHAKVEMLVSSDGDLLDLGSVAGIPIRTPEQALAALADGADRHA